MFVVRFAIGLIICLSLSHVSYAQSVSPSQAPVLSTPAKATEPHPGRYQIVVVPGHAGSPFLLDTATGCTWHLIQDEKTKRSSFIEMDVENLHWSWGSGAQSMLAARVDASELTAEQKQTLKQELQKTGCGVSGVVLTPGMQAAPTSAPEKEKPKKK